MDQDMFRKTYEELNERACVYEKSLLSGLCRCALAERFNLAEREGVHCHSDTAQQRCERFLGLLRDRSRFALKLTHEHETLPHNKTMRLQIGGLRGLHLVLTEEAIPLVIGNINGMLDDAVEQFGDLESLPYQELVKEIAAYKGRQRKK